MATIVVYVLIIMSVFTCDIKFVVFWHMFINIYIYWLCQGGNVFIGCFIHDLMHIIIYCTRYWMELSQGIIIGRNIFTKNVLAPFC